MIFGQNYQAFIGRPPLVKQDLVQKFWQSIPIMLQNGEDANFGDSTGRSWEIALPGLRLCMEMAQRSRR